MPTAKRHRPETAQAKAPRNRPVPPRGRTQPVGLRDTRSAREPLEHRERLREKLEGRSLAEGKRISKCAFQLFSRSTFYLLTSSFHPFFHAQLFHHRHRYRRRQDLVHLLAGARLAGAGPLRGRAQADLGGRSRGCRACSSAAGQATCSRSMRKSNPVVHLREPAAPLITAARAENRSIDFRRR